MNSRENTIFKFEIGDESFDCKLYSEFQSPNELNRDFLNVKWVWFVTPVCSLKCMKYILNFFSDSPYTESEEYLYEEEERLIKNIIMTVRKSDICSMLQGNLEPILCIRTLDRGMYIPPFLTKE